MTGKPYSGKLNVRFDEGELEIGQCHYASSLLYPKDPKDPRKTERRIKWRFLCYPKFSQQDFFSMSALAGYNRRVYSFNDGFAR